MQLTGASAGSARPRWSCGAAIRTIDFVSAGLARPQLMRDGVRQRLRHPVRCGISPASRSMRHEFTAIYERDDEWVIAYCPEVPGANGQGRTKDEARTSLAEAIVLILEDRREEGLRGVPAGAEREVITVDVQAA